MNAAPGIAAIQAALRAYRPQYLDLGDSKRAAVAMLLRQREDVEALLIQRAVCDGDPWSGQMAFPGGMQEPTDADSRVAAEREALEEIAVDLREHVYVGQLDDLQGRHAGHPLGLIVSGHVYQLEDNTELRPNDEVADVVWVPLQALLDPARVTRVRHPRAPEQVFLGIVIDAGKGQVLWGLTRRFIEVFFGLFDIPLVP
jgi:8-oxo-dGTP pyrophosphatase MutT (NUDIX family)